MNFSIDLVLVIGNLLFLAFSYGRFSEKISSIEQRLSKISDFLTAMEVKYYGSKDGAKLEARVDALWNKFDNHPCNRCINLKEHKE